MALQLSFGEATATGPRTENQDAIRVVTPAPALAASKGYLLAEDLAEMRWVVEEEGARIIFPNPKVRNGLRAGILIVPDSGQRLG